MQESSRCTSGNASSPSFHERTLPVKHGAGWARSGVIPFLCPYICHCRAECSLPQASLLPVPCHWVIHRSRAGVGILQQRRAKGLTEPMENLSLSIASDNQESVLKHAKNSDNEYFLFFSPKNRVCPI